MRQYRFAVAIIALALLAGCAHQALIALQSMGSFHMGGREVTRSGKPVKEVVFMAGGHYDVVNLPQMGIKGSSHRIMMHANSDQVADVIQGLYC